MSTSNAQRVLAKDGDDRALALKMFWGRVLEAFRNKTLLFNSISGDGGVGSDTAGNVVSSKSIDSGKSWQFPILGDDPTPEYHTPGSELLGMQLEVDEGTITIDDILVSHYDLPLDHTTLSHFNVIEPHARKLGRSLATDFDKKLIITGVKAALTAAVTKNGMTIHNGGNVVGRSTTTLALAYAASTTGANNFLDDAAALAQLMDEDNVPEDARFLMISPYIRRILTSYGPTGLFSKDFDASAENMANRRVIGLVAGFKVLEPTNHLPSGNIVNTRFSKYSLNATHDNDGIPAAVALCGAEEGSAGIGYVTAGGVYSHMHFDERRNTTFMKAQMLCGAGVLSPWCAGVIRVKSN